MGKGAVNIEEVTEQGRETEEEDGEGDEYRSEVPRVARIAAWT